MIPEDVASKSMLHILSTFFYIYSVVNELSINIIGVVPDMFWLDEPVASHP